MNNFKELEQEQTDKFENNINSIKTKIDSNLGTLGVFTQVIDVYFSKVINYVVSLSGGSEEKLLNRSNNKK